MQKIETLPQGVLELADELGIGERIYAVMDVTREMFPGPASAETGCDPTWPEDRWITFLVTDCRDVAESVDQEIEWNRRILEVLPDCPRAVGLTVSTHECS